MAEKKAEEVKPSAARSRALKLWEPIRRWLAGEEPEAEASKEAAEVVAEPLPEALMPHKALEEQRRRRRELIDKPLEDR